MKTDDFIGMLSTGAGPALRVRFASRLAPVLAAGFLASASGALLSLGPVPSAMLGGAALWTKLVYAAAIALACVWLARQLCRPGAPARLAGVAALVVVAAMLIAGLASLLATPAPERLRHLLGATALRCPWVIMGLALPALALLLRVLRESGPTRPALAGFAAGLLAGAVGAEGYALACLEESIAFIALWYSAGILLTGLLGAALGARLLRW